MARSFIGFHLLTSLLCTGGTADRSIVYWAQHAYTFNSTSTLALMEQVAAPALTPRAPPSNFAFSVLPIGDSITAGVGSTSGNGYRLDLHNLLAGSNVNVNFIGTQVTGDNNPDNRHEGYGANYIKDILGHIRENGILAQQKKANVVLIHAGTNDNDAERPNNGDFYATAPGRLGELIDFVLCKNPSAVVLVAILIQNKFAPEQTARFNARIPDLVAERYKKGYKIRVVDMSSVNGDQLSDLLHPNNYGYYHMAQIWHSAIMGIPSEWWITGPATPTKLGGNVEVCRQGKTFFIQALQGNDVAAGAHYGSDPGEPISSSAAGNTFSPNWGEEELVAIGVGLPGSGVRFADIDGDGRNDYIWVDFGSGAIRAWLNPGELAWEAVNQGRPITFGLPGTQFVEFADLNGDKRAEYIVVADGVFRVYRNDGRNGDVWLWSEMITAGQQLNQIFGGTAGYHYFADMNGDGRADLIVIRPDTVLDIYFNTGVNGDGFGWEPCLNKGFHVPTMWLVDIDGDGRADYLTMDAEGGVSGWLNKPGGTCGISWVAINGRGPKTVALGVGVPAGRVRLADLNGDGKADYLVVDDDGGAVHRYANGGTNHAPDRQALGGYAAGVRLADINGDGRDDYISVINQNGGIMAYLNGGQVDNNWNWAQQANGNLIAFGFAGATRNQIHFADMNGDGIDDYLVVDDSNGAVHCYLNRGPATGLTWGWTIIEGVIALGGGGAGENVRFADINGDGRADYILLSENGAAKIWLNGGPDEVLTNWQVMNGGAVAALGVGAQPKDVQFADIDGDGRADYLWVHPEDGTVDVWYNTGPLGSAVGWQSGGRIADGVGLPGQNIRFARIGTSGRADYVALQEDTGAFKVWISGCTDIIGQRAGSGTCGGPPLPPQSSAEPAPTGVPGGSGCVTSPCTPCTGNDCKGCQGPNCGGCSGPGCSGCSGSDCFSCTGADCPICNTVDCYSCTGKDCAIDGGGGGGLLTCRGSSCTVCKGERCDTCKGDDCTICQGPDCVGAYYKCRGPSCFVCRGKNCDQCEGSECETCKGSDCGDTRNDCISGQDCFHCWGRDCPGCDGDDCETCSGINCGADHNPDGRCKTIFGLPCLTCVGLGCGGGGGRCLGPFCSTCFGLGCNGCLIQPCSRCFGINCPGCKGISCSTCTGPSCGGCKGSKCTVCTGPDCNEGGNCVGEDCEPDAGRKSSTCSELSTTSKCSQTCTVSPTSTTVTTTCGTQSCSTTSGCNLAPQTGATTTTTISSACPLLTRPPNPATIAELGSGGSAGSYIYGSFTPLASILVTRTTTISPSASAGPVCNAEADFAGHLDVNQGEVDVFAKEFCDPYEFSGDYGPGTNERTVYQGLAFNGRYPPYVFQVQWKANCRTASNRQSIFDPLNRRDSGLQYLTCQDFMINSYFNCNNGGVGGYVDAGCLRYRFTGGVE